MWLLPNRRVVWLFCLMFLPLAVHTESNWEHGRYPMSAETGGRNVRLRGNMSRGNVLHPGSLGKLTPNLFFSSPPPKKKSHKHHSLTVFFFLILHQCWWWDAEWTISLHAWRSSVSRSDCPRVQFVASSMSLIQLLAGLPLGLLPSIHPWITVFSRHSPGRRIICPK